MVKDMNNEKLSNLIDDIYECNVEAIKSSMFSIELKDLMVRFENNDTLAHYFFSSKNEEILKSFVTRSEKLFDDEQLSQLTEIFGATNDGGLTPIEMSLEGNHGGTITKIFELLSNVDILKKEGYF